MKSLRYRLEGVLSALLMAIFRLMPLDMASGTGGFLGRSIGPRLAASRKALRNLEGAMPDLTAAERAVIIKDMWDNLGRVVAEYPHLETIAKKRTTVENAHIFQSLKQSGQTAVFFGAHLGNWEIWAATALIKYDTQVDITFRAPNNPIVDRLINHYRCLNGRISAHPKSPEGGRKIMGALKSGRNIAILIDQKYNEGQPIEFFNKPAMTNPIAAQLAQKYKCALIPGQCIRTKGANFILKLHDAIPTHDANDTPIPLEILMKDSNLLLEEWIKERPGQWLWLHKRWDSAQLKEKNDQA